MSLNKVILVGNFGKDPEVRYFDSGICVASFSLATTERGYTLSNGTQVPERTEWHNVVCKGDQAKFVEKWVKKGSSLYVEGSMKPSREKSGMLPKFMQIRLSSSLSAVNGRIISARILPVNRHNLNQPKKTYHSKNTRGNARTTRPSPLYTIIVQIYYLLLN